MLCIGDGELSRRVYQKCFYYKFGSKDKSNDDNDDDNIHTHSMAVHPHMWRRKSVHACVCVCARHHSITHKFGAFTEFHILKISGIAFGTTGMWMPKMKQENSVSVHILHLIRNCSCYTPVQLNFHAHRCAFVCMLVHVLFVSFRPTHAHRQSFIHLLVFSNVLNTESDRMPEFTEFVRARVCSCESSVLGACAGCLFGLLCWALH